MGGQSGVSPEILPLPTGGGAIRSIGETFSPDLHTGTGSYQVPLQFLPGPGGFRPEMSLVYSSGGGNGPFGIGWLMPLLQITRKTEGGLPAYDDDTDRFLLDRQELVPLGGRRYRHRKEESFQLAQRVGDGWEVRDRSGRRFLLGTTPATRVQETRAGVTFIYAWLIESAVDRNGNEIRYEYTRDQNQLYLQRLSYGLYSTTFVYEPRTDILTDRRAGFDIVTAQRCSAIEWRIEDDADPLFRRLRLEYDECPHTGISQLAGVTLSGHRNGSAETVSLPTLRLNYTAFEPGHRYVSFRSQTGDPPPDSLANPAFDLVDLHATGLPGVLELSGPVRRFWPNAGDGTWEPPRTLRQLPATVALGRADVAFADMNGDGAADLIELNRRPFGYYRNEPGRGLSNKVRFRQSPSFDPGDSEVRLLDLNADGIVDALRSSPAALYVYYNRGDEGWDEPIRIPRVRDAADFPDVFFSDPRVKVADMSGDGLTDIVLVHEHSLDWWPHYGNGRFGSRITLTIPNGPGRRFDPARLFLTDINGDGVADLVYVEAEHVRTWVNRGGRSIVEAGTIPFTPQASATNIRLADMFGRGTYGLVWSYPTASPAARNYKYLDFTGGVRPYLLRSIDDGTGLVTEVEYRPSTEHFTAARREGRPWTSSLPFPVQTVSAISERDTITGTVTTKSIRYYDGLFDGPSREFRGFGIAEVIEQGDTNTPSTLTRSVFHQGREDGVPDSWALTGKLLRHEIFSPDGSALATLPFRVEQNQYSTRVLEAGTNGDRVVFPFLSETSTSLSERTATAITSTSRLSFDNFGNPVRKEDEWQSGAGTQRLVSEMAYSTDTARWILNLPLELARRDGNGELLSVMRFYYDGDPFVGLPFSQLTAGNLSRREEMVLTDGAVAEVYGDTPTDFAALGYHRMTGPGGVTGWGVNVERLQVDAFGNTIARRDSLGNTGSMTFGAGGTYPTGVVDAAGHTYEAEFDLRVGQLRRLRDPNGHETHYRFDPVGRLAAVVKPGDSDSFPTVQFEYLQSSLPLGVRTRMREQPGVAATIDSVEYYDGFKQCLERRSAAEAGRVVVDNLTVRDVRGWESERVAPLFSLGFDYVPDEGAGNSRRYEFRRDAMGRVVELVTPDGRPSTRLYEAGHGTLRDVSDTDDSAENIARGHFNTPKLMEYDARGRLLAVTEDTGAAQLTTRYTRDSLGRLLSITDPRGIETVRYRYDLAGRKIDTNHVDAGRRRAVFNARGDLAVTIDALGRRTELQFDEVRRMTQVRVEGVIAERYFYDAGAGTNLIGRLARVEDESGTTTLSYTPRGNIFSKTRELATLGGPVSVSVSFSYDSMDRMTRIEHDDGRVVEYEYNPRHLVSAITGVVNALEYNVDGQLTRTLHANGVEETHTFDPQTFYLERSRITGPSRPEPYYDVAYTYDAVGNPLSISDAVVAPGHTAYQREFSYDATGQVIRSQGTLGGAAFAHVFDYDDAGNFRRNEEFTGQELFVTPGTNRIEAMETGGVRTNLFAYDANGCITSTPDATLAYDARGRLRSVTRTDGTLVEFTYDFQGERIRKRVTTGVEIRETFYSDGIYERRDGETITWVLLKDRRMAAIQAGVTTHFHHDHLGSIVLTTNGAGAIVQELAYRAFGAIASSSGAPASAGFIGNEADAETGLVYCQSRYYDPRLGRFISPDLLLLHEPEKAQELPVNLNLYIYAANNPVKLIDRDGAWWKWVVGAVIIAALVVATIVVGIATGGAGFAFGILLMASIGAALGSGIGTYAAWRAGGNLEDGFLLGAIVGGAAGAAGYAVGAAVGAGLGSGVLGSVVAGAAEGAVIGGANGAIIGYGGGAGSWQDILVHAAFGALTGAVLGGLSGYVSHLSNQGGAIGPDTIQRSLGTGSQEVSNVYGQPVTQTYGTGLAPVGQALNQAARPTLNAIIAATAHPMVYAGFGSVVHALVARDWDAISAWILETTGEDEVIINTPRIGI